MAKDEISKLLDDSKKALDLKHDSMRDQIKSDLRNLKKKALSSI